jgi:hypothetical protein
VNLSRCDQCGAPSTKDRHTGLQDGQCVRCRGNRKQNEKRWARGIQRKTVRAIDAEHTRCPACSQVKANVEFNRDASRSDGLTYSCKACISDARKGKGVIDPAGATRRARKNQLQKYGLTEEAYGAMVASQGGCCLICGTSVDRLHVDHDHSTGDVRGLLCQSCNHGLGNFKDRIDLLLRAADYLVGSKDVLTEIGVLV